jgi:hypothetical protein
MGDCRRARPSSWSRRPAGTPTHSGGQRPEHADGVQIVSSPRGPALAGRVPRGWHYDDDRSIQRLERLAALCPARHEVKHAGLASKRGRLSAVGRPPRQGEGLEPRGRRVVLGGGLRDVGGPQPPPADARHFAALHRSGSTAPTGADANSADPVGASTAVGERRPAERREPVFRLGGDEGR